MKMATDAMLSYLQAPLIAAFLILYLNKKLKSHTVRQVLKAYGLGLLAVGVFLIIDFIAESMGYDQLKNLKRSGFYSFVIIGFGSQLGVFIALRYFFLPLKSFSSPLDGVIYGVLISLGFSTVAVPLFELGFFARVPSPLLIYSLPLANLLFSVVMGFFVGLGKYRKNRLIDSLTGLGTSSFFMGFYYFGFLTSEKTIMILYGIGVLLIAFLLLVKATNIKPDNNKRI